MPGATYRYFKLMFNSIGVSPASAFWDNVQFDPNTPSSGRDQLTGLMLGRVKNGRFHVFETEGSAQN